MVEIDITPVADDTGWFRYWVSVQREITERRQREHELDRTRRLAKATLEAFSVGIWIAKPIRGPAGATADFALLEANPELLSNLVSKRLSCGVSEFGLKPDANDEIDALDDLIDRRLWLKNRVPRPAGQSWCGASRHRRPA